jgi:hypothetical protein
LLLIPEEGICHIRSSPGLEHDGPRHQRRVRSISSWTSRHGRPAPG